MQEYWNGLSHPPPGDLPNPGTEPLVSCITGSFFTAESWGKRPLGSQSLISSFKKKKKPFIQLLKYLFIWLCQVLVAAHQIFSCNVWDLVLCPGMESGLSALGA